MRRFALLAAGTAFPALDGAVSALLAVVFAVLGVPWGWLLR